MKGFREDEIVWINDLEAPTFFYTGFMYVRGSDPNLGYIILYEDLPPMFPGEPIRRRVIARTVGPIEALKGATPMREQIIDEYENRRKH